MKRNQNWCQVGNFCEQPLLFRRGTRVATFHRQDKSAWNVVDCDLDVINEVMRAERHDREEEQDEQEPEVACGAAIATGDDAEAEVEEEPACTDGIKLGDVGPDGKTTLDESKIRQLKDLIKKYKRLWEKSADKTPAAARPTSPTQAW